MHTNYPYVVLIRVQTLIGWEKRKNYYTLGSYHGRQAPSFGTVSREVGSFTVHRSLETHLRTRNLEAEREKARERMARHRASVLKEEDQGEDFRACAREASHRFRLKNAAALAHRQHILRLDSHCKPQYWCERGREDPNAFCQEGNRLYVVGNSLVYGIFSSEFRARKQIKGVLNARWWKAKSWDKVMELWNDNCDVFHESGTPSASPQATPHCEGALRRALPPPVSPLALMDAVEVFSRMGVPNPNVQAPPQSNGR
ncbi:hypothetical protein K438DRAFT_1758340 [Mycena galopus ATCC 62051]|nr:hypothetical protein K438DRAFT_1758340 [Mycena galopus ATCC 62051]